MMREISSKFPLICYEIFMIIQPSLRSHSIELILLFENKSDVTWSNDDVNKHY